MEWLRNVVANRLANNGSQWTEIYSQYNSGTYNNQNMVRIAAVLDPRLAECAQILDYNLFTPGQPLQNGTFWLCEQVPGYIRSHDLSQLLQEQGYFASCTSIAH